MVKMKFSPENVKKNPFNFPKLTAKEMKKGDKLRIAILDPEPEMGWVHNLQKPLIEDGVAVVETKTAFKSGKSYTANTMKWVSSPLCSGDLGVLEDVGIDPEHCLMCKEAKASDRVKAPKRKFALPIFVYNTKPGKTDIQNPFGGVVKLWTFGDEVYEKLTTIGEDVEDIRLHDLLLTVSNPDFNGFEIIASVKKGEWTLDKERQALAKEIFRENQPEDAMIFVGVEKDPKYVEMDLEDIRAAWRVANGTKDADDAASEDVGSVTLDEGLDTLLDAEDGVGSGSRQQKTWKAEDPLQREDETTESEDDDDSSDDDDEGSVGASVASDDDPEDFEDLLKGL